MDSIYHFPEVQRIDKQIRKNTEGKHGVAFMIDNSFGSDTSYYYYQVGDNSQADRYVNVFTFLLKKKTGEIRAYEPVTDLFMTLKAWRKERNRD